MIRFVIDSSALWRILREPAVREGWAEAMVSGAVGSCAPQRVEFRRSARHLDEYEQMGEMFDELYPDVTLGKGAWRWVDNAQYRLLRRGAHRALSLVDLLVCAAAAQHGATVLHDDGDFDAAARYLPDVTAHRVSELPTMR